MRLTELVTPLKPLEAMAMGKVLVASDAGELEQSLLTVIGNEEGLGTHSRKRATLGVLKPFRGAYN